MAVLAMGKKLEKELAKSTLCSPLTNTIKSLGRRKLIDDGPGVIGHRRRKEISENLDNGWGFKEEKRENFSSLYGKKKLDWSSPLPLHDPPPVISDIPTTPFRTLRWSFQSNKHGNEIPYSCGIFFFSCWVEVDWTCQLWSKKSGSHITHFLNQLF